MQMSEKSRYRRFVASIIMLMAGMTIGFLLLGTVYDGPVWVKAVVFVVYLAVSTLVIRYSRRYAEYLKTEEGKR